MVEAKYRSSKHNLTVEHGPSETPVLSELVEDPDDDAVASTDGDQLADYFCALLEGNIRLTERRKQIAHLRSGRIRPRSFRGDDLLRNVSSDSRYLLYLTAHYRIPRSDIDETLASLFNRNIPTQRCHQLFWINWRS